MHIKSSTQMGAAQNAIFADISKYIFNEIVMFG